MKPIGTIQVLDHFYYFEIPEIQIDYNVAFHNTLQSWLKKKGYSSDCNINKLPFFFDETKVYEHTFHVNGMNYVVVTELNQSWLLSLFVEDIKNTLNVWELHAPETFTKKINEI